MFETFGAIFMFLLIVPVAGIILISAWSALVMIIAVLYRVMSDVVSQ